MNTWEHGFSTAYYSESAEVWCMQCDCGFIASDPYFTRAADKLSDHWTREIMRGAFELAAQNRVVQ